ncbi:hypothetical protein VII00023_10120 [Vibrio ichthyoenteri ATCC 700023]|uniref:Uncharacterized protein n=1 Tax=Vibrio ichthyoenteri ATCC 700023 TaxID=870968 RepID=F9RWD1_9VIBR|nr:hypothetical protein [Vibrio ichthyoenteri]EGU49384.1 hypothetical protein VII00023_10120 [Vibrio ichthyoenteri ATCC 700023]
MITVERKYCLSDSPDLHARVEVNPLGKLEVEIIELNQRHSSEFDDLSFICSEGGIRVCGKDNALSWHLSLATGDGLELSNLVDNAHEEYETLMRDLM